jgi:hypothetical protein
MLEMASDLYRSTKKEHLQPLYEQETQFFYQTEIFASCQKKMPRQPFNICFWTKQSKIFGQQSFSVGVVLYSRKKAK